MSACADERHSPVKALKALGLEHHPSAALITGYRDLLHAKIVYHADPVTLYRVAQESNSHVLENAPSGTKPADSSKCPSGDFGGSGAGAAHKAQAAQAQDASISGCRMKG